MPNFQLGRIILCKTPLLVSACSLTAQTVNASSMENSEHPLSDQTGKWLDLSPFVSYMLDVFEQCMIDAALSRNELTTNESKLLDRMNRVSGTAEITVKKSAAILGNSESAARNTLRSLVKKGYLTEDMSKVPFIYSLEQHFPE